MLSSILNILFKSLTFINVLSEIALYDSSYTYHILENYCFNTKNLETTTIKQIVVYLYKLYLYKGMLAGIIDDDIKYIYCHEKILMIKYK